MNKTLLSICIPTYNRLETLHKSIDGFCGYPDTGLELVISDASDNTLTEEYIRQKKDPRILYLKRGGSAPLEQLFQAASGSFLLYCLDKDIINYKYLSILKQYLSKHPEVCVGRCAAAFKAAGSKEIMQYPRGIASLYRLAYVSAHPSGYFFKKSCYRRVRRQYGMELTNFDVWSGWMCCLGDGVYCSLPVIKTENPRAARCVKTYLNRDVRHLFFFPEERIRQCEEYLSCIAGLKLKKSERFRLLARVLEQQLLLATDGYQSVMKNRDICMHYNINTRNIKPDELAQIKKRFYLMTDKALIHSGLPPAQVCLLHIWLYLKSAGYHIKGTKEEENR